MSLVLHKLPDIGLAAPQGPVLKANLSRDFTHSESLLAKAHADAEKILQAANHAYEASRQQGRRDGLAEARNIEARRGFMLAAKGVEYLAVMEDRILAMAETAMRQIAGQMDVKALNWQLVRKALARYRNLPDLTLRVPPDAEAGLRRHLAELGQTEPLPALRIESDARLEAGQCLLESPLGKVNIGLANQLAQLHQTLAGSKKEPLALTPATSTNTADS